MSKFIELVKSIALNFIQAWNRGDFIEIENTLHENVYYKSPLISSLSAIHQTSELHGKQAVLNYLKEVYHSKVSFFFNFDTVQIIKDSDWVRIESELIDNSFKLFAKFRHNEYGKLIHLEIDYTDTVK